MNQHATAGKAGNRQEERSSSNWWNRIRYGLYAPVYDWVAKPFESGRRHAFERVDPKPAERILIPGCDTGMELKSLPADASVTAIDVSEVTVQCPDRRADPLGVDVDARVDDAQSLPFEDDSFGVVL